MRSWDKTVRLWDVYGGRGQTDVLPHAHDVLAVAFRPDGKQVWPWYSSYCARTHLTPHHHFLLLHIGLLLLLLLLHLLLLHSLLPETNSAPDDASTKH